MEYNDLLNGFFQSNEVVELNLKLFLPNNKNVVSLSEKNSIYFREDVTLQRFVVDHHFLKNYYYLKKAGVSGYKFIGVSNDWDNLCEIEVDRNIFDGQGTYFVKAVAKGESKGKTYIASDIVSFDVVE